MRLDLGVVYVLKACDEVTHTLAHALKGPGYCH